MQAMKTEGLEPIVIEDLVRFGEDRGYERGLREGTERGLRDLAALARAILDGLVERGVVLDAAQRARIEGETDPARLREWLRAVVAGRAIEP
jgi:hypothetical protein